MYAVIRVRGQVHANQKVRDTLAMLHLTHINNCTIVREDGSYRGMLQKVKDFVTWGEVNEETLEKLLSAKAGLEGDHLQEAVSQIMSGKASLRDFTNPPLRLHPPVKGYEGVKRPYRLGGALGYRGKDINELIERML